MNRLLRTYPLVLFAIAMLLFPSAANSADDGWQSDKMLATDYLVKRNCAAAWPLLWKWGETGNSEALNLIASGIFTHGMTIPGGKRDKLALNRYLFIFLAFGLSPEAPESQQLFESAFEHLLFPEHTGNPIGECLRSTNQLTSCAELAVNQKFIPSFDEFKAEINSLTIGSEQTSICSFKPFH